MSDMADKLIRLREERIAREKARIEKLRELNLKKYNKNEPSNIVPSSSAKLLKSNSVTSVKSNISVAKNVKNNFQVNGTTKRPIDASLPRKPDFSNVKAKVETKLEIKPVLTEKVNVEPSSTQQKVKSTNFMNKTENVSKPSISNTILEKKVSKDLPAKTFSANVSKIPEKKVLTEIKVLKEIPKTNIKKFDIRRKSLAVPQNNYATEKQHVARKSILPQLPEKSESVFERLYKPKRIENREPNLLKKAVKNSTINKRHTVFDNSVSSTAIPRRSISAIHLKKISKSEMSNCIHKWASIGEKLDRTTLEMNEDDKIQEDKVVSAVKSERKKVTFMTPVPSMNTPRPEELQARLKAWLQKKGKSLNSYHHLQCFGINHMRSEPSPKFSERFDEENKENIALESDSEDGSYSENMNEGKEPNKCKIDIYNWRKASFDAESVGFNDSVNLNDTTLTADAANVDDLLIGALNDLTNLLREGFEWQQSARWLRSIRASFPGAPNTAAYWECRAALEDSRGDLPASVHCWQEAVAKGTEHSVVESNLDLLLDKFMQLKISPKSGNTVQLNPKLVDVKNVFKSTFIRFAVQEAKLRQNSDTPMFTVTPVRRSGRLSHCPARGICDSVTQAANIAPLHVFTPNKHLVPTP